MSTKDTLKTLGFTEKEAEIYLALLELGEATVLAISRKSGIKRPTAYVLLQSLEAKGFATRVVKTRKTYFTVPHPQKLLSEAEFRLKELQETLPQLASLYHKGEGRPRVMIYEGKERLDQAYDDWFITPGGSLFIGTITVSKEWFPRTFRKLEYKPRSPEFRIRELLTDDEAARSYAREMMKSPYHQVRFFPPHIAPFSHDIGIYGNRVLISLLKKEYFVVVLESAEIVNSFRTIFELLWNAVGQE